MSYGPASTDSARTRPVWIDEVPEVRTVDQFAGNPSKWWEANARADARIAELRNLRQENARLLRDNIALRRQCDALLTTDKGELLTRNEELEDELVGLREAHNIALGLRSAKTDGDSWCGKAEGGLR